MGMLKNRVPGKGKSLRRSMRITLKKSKKQAWINQREGAGEKTVRGDARGQVMCGFRGMNRTLY